MRKPALAASTQSSRRARTLAAALSVLFVGTAIYAHNVRAEAAPGRAVDQPQTHPRDSLGISTLGISARAASATGENGARATHAPAMPIAWTSPWGRDGRLQQIPTR